MTETRLFGFAPFIPEGARLLILGSMPSVASLEQGFYYAHPRNRMFMLLHDYLEEYTKSVLPPLKTIEERQEALRTLKIGMYDVVTSCEREGSLDSRIRNPEYADIAALVQQFPTLKTVITVGGFAAKKIRHCHLDTVDVQYFALPSTSPCYTLRYEILKERFDTVFRPYLQSLGDIKKQS